MKNDLSERLLEFAAGIIKLTDKISKSYTGRHIGKQLMRSATSSGADYEEACGAESKADFIHKMQIVLKESIYWLKLIRKSKINVSDELDFLLNESDELAKIFAIPISIDFDRVR